MPCEEEVTSQVERLNGKERKDPGQSSGSSGDAELSVA